jgi:hypothetical protein
MIERYGPYDYPDYVLWYITLLEKDHDKIVVNTVLRTVELYEPDQYTVVPYEEIEDLYNL